MKIGTLVIPEPGCLEDHAEKYSPAVVLEYYSRDEIKNSRFLHHDLDRKMSLTEHSWVRGGDLVAEFRQMGTLEATGIVKLLTANGIMYEFHDIVYPCY